MTKKPYPSELADRFQVRMPEGLRGRIAAAADANGRSMNAEIVHTLEEAYPPEPTIEDLIFYAGLITDEYLDTPDYARLRQLREALQDLVAELKKGRQNGYPETEREALERQWNLRDSEPRKE